MSSVRKRGGRPNRGGGRFNKPASARGRGNKQRGGAHGGNKSRGGGVSRKQDSFQFEDEVLDFGDDYEDGTNVGHVGAYGGGSARGAPGGRGAGRGRGRGGRTKVQMQHIHMSTENQDMVREMLLALHSNPPAPTTGEEEGEEPEYDELDWRAEDQYWTHDRQLVVEGAAGPHDDEQQDSALAQQQRFTQLAAQKLARYGFAESRCRAVLEQTDGDIGCALEHLLSEAFSLPLHQHHQHDTEEGLGITSHNADDASDDVTEEEDTQIREQREEEKLALEAIYGDKFHVRIPDRVWTLSLDLPALTELASAHACGPSRASKPSYTQKVDPRVCRHYLQGRCRFGSQCKFLHKVLYQETDRPAHTQEVCDFEYQLEIRFPPKNRYPFDPPFIAFQSTNHLLPRHVCLSVTSRLTEEARDQGAAQLPVVFTLASLLEDELELSRLFFQPPHKYSLPEPLVANRPQANQKKSQNQSKDSSQPASSDAVHCRPGANHAYDDTHRHKHSAKQNDLHKKYSRKDNVQKPLGKQEISKTDRGLREKFKKVQEVSSYREMQSARRELPAWTEREHILDTINKSQVTVLSGMTGCGKTTQVPQFVLDASLCGSASLPVSHVVVTQPRRISALSVAERVSAERAERPGGIVGYQIRLESAMSARTRLLFCTTGILLRRLEGDAELGGVTHVIVDEVHERSQESDFLLMILRDLLPMRKDLKVILMSATVNAEQFSEYFGNCPMIHIPGKTFPVEEYFVEDAVEMMGYVIDETSHYARPLKSMNAESRDKRPTRASVEEIEESLASLDVCALPPKNNIRDSNLTPRQLYARYSGYEKSTVKQLAIMNLEIVNFDLIESLLVWICTGRHDMPREGAILVFLQGLTDIQTLYDSLRSNSVLGARNRAKYKIVPLHSSLSSTEQRAVFTRPPEGVRKIVLSTNMAETSVTIDDVVFVIDCGLMKEKHYDVSKGMESLDSVWVSRANALQRRGRAGRVMAGVCFHLFTGHRYDHHLKDQPVPEMQRAPLEQSILRVKTLDLFRGQDVAHVLTQLIEAPSSERVEAAVRRLQELGALDPERELTPLGYHLSALPVDVRIGKLMLFGCIFRCLDPALTIAATLSYKSPFVAPFGKKKEATAKKLEFAAGNSDHVTSLRAYQVYEKAASKGSPHAFCSENFICSKTVKMLGSMKRQFVELLSDIGFVQSGVTSRDVERLSTRGSDGVLAASGHTVNSNSENLRLVAAILVAALYPNVVQVLSPETSFQMASTGAVPRAPRPEDLRFKTKEDGYVNIHPSSVNFQVRHYDSPYLVYHEKLKTSKLFIRDCTMVSVYPLLLFAGGVLSIDLDRGHFVLSVDEGWIRFRVSDNQVAELLREVRLELDQLLQDKIQNPDLDLNSCPRGNKIITTIVRLITTQ